VFRDLISRQSKKEKIGMEEGRNFKKGELARPTNFLVD
jgi:hypothetical protein